MQPHEIDRLIAEPAECESLEFKEAKATFDLKKLLQYVAAFSNEGGGRLVLGVSDKIPRQIVGTRAWLSRAELNDVKSRVLNKLGIRIDIDAVDHECGRVLVLSVPGRPMASPVALDGTFWMRCGEELRPMSPDRLRQIFDEDSEDWFLLPTTAVIGDDQVVSMLDTQSFFDLLERPYPTNRGAVLEMLASESLIEPNPPGWRITNLGALLIAKDLRVFGTRIARKAPRCVFYDSDSKLATRGDRTFHGGFASAFSSLVDFVHAASPMNLVVEQVVRQEVKMFPLQALRELIANALIHQDFSQSGASTMIEMYSDRVEISNPGTPPIDTQRFIDEYRSRNERFADLMRRMRICEEKGSGIDKVVFAAEDFQLPAPDFRAGATRTTAILFAHRGFSNMDRNDRIRACYQHCVLLYVCNRRMTNATLRKRFGLDSSGSSSSTTSQIIAATKEEGLIKKDDRRSYVPTWA